MIMAKNWLKSLQCKSRAYDDVYHPPSISCRNSYQNLKDVVNNVDHLKPKPRPKPGSKHVRHVNFPYCPEPRKKHAEKTSGSPKRAVSGPVNTKGPVGFGLGPVFSSVEELEEGHPSRNVVEMIFGKRWGPDGFPGRVEMVFKIQNPARFSSGFEEYRELVKMRAGPGTGARCVADGNEMMRFHCLGPDGYDGATSTVVCTYSGSGVAHDSVGGGKGRRAMVVCRVIAGRVVKRVGLIEPVVKKSFDLGEFDSVSGENGELLVFDSRAVLPCFLVIYNL